MKDAMQVQRTPVGPKPLNAHDVGLKVARQKTPKPMGPPKLPALSKPGSWVGPRHTTGFQKIANEHTMGTNIV